MQFLVPLMCSGNDPIVYEEKNANIMIFPLNYIFNFTANTKEKQIKP